MTTYVALLRGINLAGKRPVKMERLRSLFEAAGHEGASTYLQSGNVIFSADGRRSATTIEAELERLIEDELDLTVDVLLRSHDELTDVMEHHPFLADAEDPRHLHVTFLKAEPDAEVIAELEAPPAGDDEFELGGREVFLHCPGGYGRTKLNNALWERRLRVPATTRNWNTVTQLAELTIGGKT